MNERIRELSEQARIKDHWSIDEARYLTNYLDEKKFAELLIREAAAFVSGATEVYNQAEQDACVRASKGLMKHFGVEE